MRARTTFPPLLAVLAAVTACSEAGDPAGPGLPIDVPPPELAVVDGGEVNTTISVTPIIQCSSTGTVTVSIQGITPPPDEAPVDVILVLDESGSIDGTEYASVIAASKAFLEAMDQADGADDNVLSAVRIGVVKYATSATVRQGLTDDYADVLNAVASRYYSGGGTSTTTALNTARSHLVAAQRPNAATAVVLMTDGYSSQSGGVTAANQIRAIGAAVYAVGVGSQVNTGELQSVANPGNYYPAANFSDLTAAFEAIAGEITYPAATDLTFTADVPAGFTLVSGSASATKGIVAEGAGSVTWTVSRLDAETITMTYEIQHDFGAAPSGGVMTAVSGAVLTLTTPKSKVPFSEDQADVSTDVQGCDITPPEISYVLTGDLGANDWYTSDVVLDWTVVDNESPITSQTGCDQVTTTTDGASYSFTCEATSAGGTASETATFKRDATDPEVAFTGNAGAYDIADQVQMTCSATDNLSGIASDSCADVDAGAWSFLLGANTVSADATDDAGNTSSTTETFTVSSSYAGLCTLVQQWVEHKGVANSLCVKIDAADRAQARGNTNARDGSLGAFINEVGAQSGQKVPADKAPLLILFAQALMS